MVSAHYDELCVTVTGSLCHFAYRLEPPKINKGEFGYLTMRLFKTSCSLAESKAVGDV